MKECTNKKRYISLWILAIFLLIIFLFIFINIGNDKETELGTITPLNETITSINKEEKIENIIEQEKTEIKNVESSKNTGKNDNITTGQKNALNSAKQYLSIMAFSYKGLVKQLEYEGYSNAEATYGVKNCEANWNEQASKMAKEYLDTMPFSRSRLIDQLKYSGFTQEQAEYGAKAVGY